MTYTHFPAEPADGIDYAITQCNDCGAFVRDGSESDVEHYPSCDPGSAERWAKHYAEEDDEFYRLT